MIDDDNEIILAYCLNKKSLECASNNDIPIKIPDHLYILVSKCILCDCELEVEESFLLDSLAACMSHLNEFKMYPTVNVAYLNYFDNWDRFYYA